MKQCRHQFIFCFGTRDVTLKSHSQNRQEAAPEGGQQRLYKAFFSTMVNHTKSQKLKKIEAATLKDMLNSLAIAQYKSEHADPAETERKLGRPPYTLRNLCDIIPKDYTHRTNKPAPSLSKSTLQRLLSGKIPKTKSAKQCSWLLESEVEVVVNYLLEMASRGFPLTQQRLKDVVDDICRARLCYTDLLNIPPATELEERLQAALREAENKYESLKAEVIVLQSGMVLNNTYCDILKNQLAAQEEARQKKRKTRLVGDGLPRLLSSEEFVQRVIEYTAEMQKKEETAKQKKLTCEERKGSLAEWKKLGGRPKERECKISGRVETDVYGVG